MSSIKKSPGARTFGGDPAAYDLARPGYPPELFAWLGESCGLGAGNICFEIGAGTGQATLPVLDLGVRSILAIEPDTALADHLSGVADGRVGIVKTRFEETPLQSNAFDFGFAATSFHWVKRMRALGASLAALRPGGQFAMWWNVYHDPARADAFDAALAPAFEGLEQNPRMAGGTAFALDANSRLGEMRKAGFVRLQHQIFSWRRVFSGAQLAALYETFSRVQTAPARIRERLLDEVKRIAVADFGDAVERRIATSVFVGAKPASDA